MHVILLVLLLYPSENHPAPSGLHQELCGIPVQNLAVLLKRSVELGLLRNFWNTVCRHCVLHFCHLCTQGCVVNPVWPPVTVTVTEALVLRPLLEDRGCITESVHILVPVDRMKQKCFQFQFSAVPGCTYFRVW